jgi:hypothetical protein
VPIRFRCAYCNQLMGISHRKAGTVVSCPTCSGQIVVPTPAGPAPAAPGPGGTAGPSLFERSEFGKVFEAAAEAVTVPPAVAPAQGVVPAPVPAGAWGTQLDGSNPQGPVALAPLPPPPPGVVLTPVRLAVLAVLEILLLAGAFGAGVLVGRHLLPR